MLGGFWHSRRLLRPGSLLCSPGRGCVNRQLPIPKEWDLPREGAVRFYWWDPRDKCFNNIYCCSSILGTRKCHITLLWEEALCLLGEVRNLSPSALKLFRAENAVVTNVNAVASLGRYLLWHVAMWALKGNTILKQSYYLCLKSNSMAAGMCIFSGSVTDFTHQLPLTSRSVQGNKSFPTLRQSSKVHVSDSQC